MPVILFETALEKATGLIGMRPISAETLFVFTKVQPGALFHSIGVLESFDLVFVDAQRNVLLSKRMTPPGDVLVAPPGTVEAWESKAGELLS